MEGIRLAIEGGGVEYDEEISGRALFLLQGPELVLLQKVQLRRVAQNLRPLRASSDLKERQEKQKLARTDRVEPRRPFRQ